MQTNIEKQNVVRVGFVISCNDRRFFSIAPSKSASASTSASQQGEDERPFDGKRSQAPHWENAKCLRNETKRIFIGKYTKRYDTKRNDFSKRAFLTQSPCSFTPKLDTSHHRKLPWPSENQDAFLDFQYGGWPFAFWAGRGQRNIEPDKRETASDRPSIQSKLRPTTARPVLLRRKSYIVLRARILVPRKAHTKVAAFDRHQKRGGGAFGRATPFVVSVVCALTGASILALNTIYDLRLSKTGRTVVGGTFDWMDGRSDADSLLSGSFSKMHARMIVGSWTNGRSPYEELQLVKRLEMQFVGIPRRNLLMRLTKVNYGQKKAVH